jgi:DNA-binding response OmpR family regulator
MVDDDRHVRLYFQARLGFLGARLRMAANAPEAVALLQEERPGLILCDAVMPGMDGFALCRMVKQDPDLAGVPFVILTSLSRNVRERSLEAGADDYLSKQETDLTLRIRLRSLLALGAGRPMPSPSLLLVSPSRVIHAQVTTQLTKEGIRVEGPADPGEVGRLLADRMPDGLILDLAAGEGLALWLQRLRALPGCSRMPILALAGREEAARLEAVEPFIQDWLPKPLDGPECRHRAGLLLRMEA